MEDLSVYSERRPRRTENDRAWIAAKYSEHLPKSGVISMSDDDLNAMRAAHISRFDEDLPRTETLMSVAMIGYRMALRDRGEL